MEPLSTAIVASILSAVFVIVVKLVFDGIKGEIYLKRKEFIEHKKECCIMDVKKDFQKHKENHGIHDAQSDSRLENNEKELANVRKDIRSIRADITAINLHLKRISTILEYRWGNNSLKDVNNNNI